MPHPADDRSTPRGLALYLKEQGQSLRDIVLPSWHKRGTLPSVGASGIRER